MAFGSPKRLGQLRGAKVLYFCGKVNPMAKATFDKVLDAIEHLPAEEQADLVQVVQRRLAERGRRRVINEIKEARSQFDRSKAKPASVNDLMREIES